MMKNSWRLVRNSALVMLLSAFFADTALSQVPRAGRLPCHDHSELAKQLGAKYKEAPVSIGLQSNGNLLQVFASKDSGSWTILSTTPKGMSCILAAGKRWEQQKPMSFDPET